MSEFLLKTTANRKSIIENIDYIYIPAGSSQKISNEIKHNLFFGEKTSLENILDISLQLKTKVISTVKDCEKIRKKYKTVEDILILEARDNLIDSSIYALIEGYINYYSEQKFTKNWGNIRKIKQFLKENPNLEDLTILCVASDSPFLNIQDLKKFIINYSALKKKPDIYVGLTNMDRLSHIERELKLDIDSIHSTLSNYCITDRGIFRISNMYILKPFKLINIGLAGSLQKIYDNRKLSEGITPYLGILSGFSSIFTRAIIHPEESLQFIKNIYTASKHFRQNYIGDIIRLNSAFENTSKVIGLDIKCDTTCSLGPLLDIDDSESYYFFKKNYEVIKEYLQKNNSLSHLI